MPSPCRSPRAPRSHWTPWAPRTRCKCWGGGHGGGIPSAPPGLMSPPCPRTGQSRSPRSCRPPRGEGGQGECPQPRTVTPDGGVSARGVWPCTPGVLTGSVPPPRVPRATRAAAGVPWGGRVRVGWEHRGMVWGHLCSRHPFPAGWPQAAVLGVPLWGQGAGTPPWGVGVGSVPRTVPPSPPKPPPGWGWGPWGV